MKKDPYLKWILITNNKTRNLNNYKDIFNSSTVKLDDIDFVRSLRTQELNNI